jgi:hypothetical protein
MCSTSRRVPVTRFAGISAARAMALVSMDVAAVPPASCMNLRRLIPVIKSLSPWLVHDGTKFRTESHQAIGNDGRRGRKAMAKPPLTSVP